MSEDIEKLFDNTPPQQPQERTYSNTNNNYSNQNYNNRYNNPNSNGYKQYNSYNNNKDKWKDPNYKRYNNNNNGYNNKSFNKTYTKAYNKYNKDNYTNFKTVKVENYWDKLDIIPQQVAVKSFKDVGKYVYLDYNSIHAVKGIVPIEKIDPIVNKLSKALDILIANRIKIRFTTSKTDTVMSKISNRLDCTVDELYTPWNSITELKPKKMYSPNDKAYSIMANYITNFKDLSPAIRANISTRVNMVLGKDILSPVKALIIYTENQLEEYPSKDAIAKEFGFIKVPLLIAKLANIPVFNVAKEDTLDRLTKFIEILNKQ